MMSVGTKRVDSLCLLPKSKRDTFPKIYVINLHPTISSNNQEQLKRKTFLDVFASLPGVLLVILEAAPCTLE